MFCRLFNSARIDDSDGNCDSIVVPFPAVTFISAVPFIDTALCQAVDNAAKNELIVVFSWFSEKAAKKVRVPNCAPTPAMGLSLQSTKLFPPLNETVVSVCNRKMFAVVFEENAATLCCASTGRCMISEFAFTKTSGMLTKMLSGYAVLFVVLLLLCVVPLEMLPVELAVPEKSALLANRPPPQGSNTPAAEARLSNTD